MHAGCHVRVDEHLAGGPELCAIDARASVAADHRRHQCRADVSGSAVVGAFAKPPLCGIFGSVTCGSIVGAAVNIGAVYLFSILSEKKYGVQACSRSRLFQFNGFTF